MNQSGSLAKVNTERGTAKKQKILVADDTKTILQFVDEILSGAGYDVVAVKNSFGISAAVIRERPDLVLLDYNMPALRGDIIAAFIKKERKDTKIVFLSGEDESVLQEAVARTSVEGYIIKPVTPKDLINAVRGFLAQT